MLLPDLDGPAIGWDDEKKGGGGTREPILGDEMSSLSKGKSGGLDEEEADRSGGNDCCWSRGKVRLQGPCVVFISSPLRRSSTVVELNS